MLKAINVTKTYNAGKKVALNNFSIEVPKEVFTVFWVLTVPEKHHLSVLSIRLPNRIAEKFLLMAKN
jgi:hypothetical protein